MSKIKGKPNSDEKIETVYGVTVEETEISSGLYTPQKIIDTGSSNHVKHLYNSFKDNVENYKTLFHIDSKDNTPTLYQKEFGVFKYYGAIKALKKYAEGNEYKIYLLNTDIALKNNSVEYQHDTMFKMILICLKILYLYNGTTLKRIINDKKLSLYYDKEFYYFDILEFTESPLVASEKTDIKDQFDIIKSHLSSLHKNSSMINLWKPVFKQVSIINAVNTLYSTYITLKQKNKELKPYIGWENDVGKESLVPQINTSHKLDIDYTIEQPSFADIVMTKKVMVKDYFTPSTTSISIQMINDFIGVVSHITPFYVHAKIDLERIKAYKKTIKMTFRSSMISSQFHHDIILFIQLCAIYLRVYSLYPKIKAIDSTLQDETKLLTIYEKHRKKFSEFLYKYERNILETIDKDRSKIHVNKIKLADKGLINCNISDIERTIYEPIIKYLQSLYKAQSNDHLKNLGLNLSDPHLYDKLLKTLQLAICKSTERISIDIIYKDDLDEFIEQVVPTLFRGDLKDIINISEKILKLKPDANEYITLFCDFHNKIKNTPVSWDSLRKFFMEVDEQERGLYLKAVKYYSKDIYISLIELFENLSGSVRVYVKLRDNKLTDTTYNKNDKNDKNEVKFQLVEQKQLGEHWISRKNHILLKNNSHIILGTHQCLMNNKLYCRHFEFGPFYRVIPPYTKINDNYKQLSQDVIANDYINIDNIVKLFTERRKTLYLTLFTYGYSGSGKTYTLFGENYTGGIMSVIENKLKGKITLTNKYALTGYVQPNNMIFDKIDTLTEPTVSDIFQALTTNKDAEDSFIKVTTNNPESSRGFLFFEYNVKVNDNEHKLIVVDMAGNEDPLDILIKTLPSYEIPIYKEPGRKTFIESQRIVNIEKFSKMTMNAIVMNIFYALTLTYTPLYNLQSAKGENVVAQRLLNSRENKLNTENGTIFSILRSVSDNYDSSISFNKFYDYEKHLKIMKPFLFPLLKNHQNILNYSMYYLVFQLIERIYTVLSDKMSLSDNSQILEAFNIYTNELETLKINKQFRSIEKENGQDYLNLQKTMQNICSNILTKIRTELSLNDSKFTLFETEAIKDIFKTKMNLSRPFIYGIMILYEIHKTILNNVTNYSDIISKSHEVLLTTGEDSTDFLESSFEKLTNDKTTLKDNNTLNEIHLKISNTIDKLYFAIPKNGVRETAELLLKSIEKLSAIQYTIDMYFQLKNNIDYNTGPLFNDLIEFKLILKPSNSNSHEFTYLDSKSKQTKKLLDLSDTTSSTDVQELRKQIATFHNISKYDPQISNLLQKLEFSNIVNNSTFDKLFGNLRTNIVIHKTNGIIQQYSNMPSYFKRIIMEGYYINQVNYELISLLKHIREDKKITDEMITELKNDKSRYITTTDTMYGIYYNTNSHLNRLMDPSDEDFRMTNLYFLLNNLLKLDRKDIDRKFFMIANIRPDEAKYRPGAINTLQLMQELALPE